MRGDGGEHEALIAIGSNIDPERNIPSALALLKNEVSIRAISNFYRSQPLGGFNQAQFLNGACRIATPLPPRQLKFSLLRGIESKLGRVRSADKYAPREIDLDIALYGNREMNEDGLLLPDPDIQHRPFLAIPLAEIAADWVLPGVGATLGEIAAGLSRSGLTPDSDISAACRRIVSEELQT